MNVEVRALTLDSAEFGAVNRLFKTEEGELSFPPCAIHRTVSGIQGTGYAGAVALRGGEIVGVILGQPSGPYSMINHAVVLPSERGSGLGTQLTHFHFERLRSFGVNRVVLRAGEEPARYWRKFGFSELPGQFLFHHDCGSSLGDVLSEELLLGTAQPNIFTRPATADEVRRAIKGSEIAAILLDCDEVDERIRDRSCVGYAATDQFGASMEAIVVALNLGMQGVEVACAGSQAGSQAAILRVRYALAMNMVTRLNILMCELPREFVEHREFWKEAGFVYNERKRMFMLRI